MGKYLNQMSNLNLMSDAKLEISCWGLVIILRFLCFDHPKKKLWLPKISASTFKPCRELRGVLGPEQRQGLVVFRGKSQGHEVHPGK